MKQICRIVLFASLPVCCAKADIMVKSIIENSTGGAPPNKMTTVEKIKGPWRFSKTEMKPMKIPGTLQSITMPAMPAMLVNVETREMFQMNEGKWQKQSGLPAAQMEMAEKARGGNSMANAKFKPTGRKEKIREHDTEVWESIDDSNKITVWVAPALKKIKDQMVMGSPGMTKEAEAKMRAAWAVLPGMVVRSRVESDMSKKFAASMPPGAKMPAGMPNMKSVMVSEVEEIKEVNFSDEEFPLP